MNKDDSRKCFAKTFLLRQEEVGLSDDDGAYDIGTLFEAGAGTTAAPMMSFTLAICYCPEWQGHMQDEVCLIRAFTRL